MTQQVKYPSAKQETQETWVRSVGQEDSLGGGNGNPFQCPCLKNSHGQRSLEGHSPQGLEESDMTEQLSACVCTHTVLCHKHVPIFTQLHNLSLDV